MSGMRPPREDGEPAGADRLVRVLTNFPLAVT